MEQYPSLIWYHQLQLLTVQEIINASEILKTDHFIVKPRKKHVKQEKIDKATRNKEAAKANETPFIEVEEDDESISLYYEPAGWVEFDENEVPHMIPMTRWSYEEALTHLAASTKPQVHFSNVSTQKHMEHMEKILGSCGHFENVGFSSQSPMNAQIYNLVKKKATEMENSNIYVRFETEFDGGENLFDINVKSNGFRIDCQILDPERIAYPHLLDFLKEGSNKNNIVFIELAGPNNKFKDLFVELGWQYEYYIEENVTNGVASNVRLMNDNNVYGLEYWDHIDRSLDNAHHEADSDSGVSLQGDFFL